MHRFSVPYDRSMVILTAGNLATSQAVVAQIQRDLEEDTDVNIFNARYVSDVADYIGEISLQEQQKYAKKGGPNAGFNASATFILGGQIKGHAAGAVHDLPRGQPHHRLGPLSLSADRRDQVRQADPRPHHPPDTPVETAMRCALVSVDSTMRSNATVGPPWSACSTVATACCRTSTTACSRRTTPISRTCARAGTTTSASPSTTCRPSAECSKTLNRLSMKSSFSATDSLITKG
jgi:hypothetical protein